MQAQRVTEETLALQENVERLDLEESVARGDVVDRMELPATRATLANRVPQDHQESTGHKERKDQEVLLECQET